MSRELKFRAWHIPTNEMFWFDVMDGNHAQGQGYIGMTPFSDGKSLPGRHRGNMRLIDPNDCEPLMQFTGLMDKNGVEIWEGDICRAEFNFHGKPSKDIAFNCKIIYNSNIGSFQISYENINGNFVSDTIYSRYFLEVIGNIHQNPDLI